MSQERVSALWQRLQSEGQPKGFAAASDDLDIDVFERDDYVAGLAQTYVDTGHIDRSKLDPVDEVGARLTRAQEALDRLKARYELQQEVLAALRNAAR